MCAQLVDLILAFRQSEYDQSDWMLIDRGTSMWPYKCRDGETWCYILKIPIKIKRFATIEEVKEKWERDLLAIPKSTF